MADQQIKVGMDTSDVGTALSQMAQQFKAQGLAVKDLALEMAKFNKQGNLTSAILKGMNDDQKEVTLTVRRSKDEFKAVNVVVSENARVTRDAARAARELAAAQKEADRKSLAGAVDSRVRQALPINQSVTGAQAVGFESRLNSVQKIIENGKVSLLDFERILTAVSQKKPLEGLTGAHAQLQALLRSLGDIAQGTQNVDKEARRWFISMQGLVRLFEAQVIHRALGAIITEMTNAVQKSAEFQVRISELRTISQENQLAFGHWAAGIRKISDEFSRPIADVAAAAYQTLSNQVAKGAQTFDFLATAGRFANITVSSLKDSVDLLSGALTAYNLDASQAERVSAVLFKTIDLGRTTATEMANSFGRVAVISAQVGIRLEELTAAIATVTRTGVKYSDAATQITNVVTHLLKPTVAMKQLFQEWGVNSGEAAIATFGFLGVLQRLDQEAEKGSERVAELQRDIRAMRGAFSLSGEGAKQFASDLKQMENAQLAASNAAKIMEESAGKQFLKTMNQLKNFFQEDFGTPIVATLNGLIESVKSLDGIMGVSGRTFKTVATFVGAYVVAAGFVMPALARANAAILASRLALSGQGAALLTGRSAWLAYGAAVATSMGPLLAVTAAIAAVTLIAQSNTEALDRIKQGGRDVELQEQEKNRKVSQEEAKSFDQRRETFRKLLDENYQGALKNSADMVKVTAQRVEKEIELNKQVTENLKLSWAEYQRHLQSNINNTKSEITHLETRIKQSIDSMAGAERKIRDKVFDKRVGLEEDPGLRLQMLQRRMQQLEREAREGFERGDDTSIKQARENFNQLEKLAEQELDLRVQQRKIRVEMGKETLPVTRDSEGREVRRLDLSREANEFERKSLNYVQTRKQLEEESRRVDEQRKGQLDDILKKRQQDFDIIKQSVKELTELKLMDEQGKVKKEFKKEGTRNEIDMDRVEAFIKERQSRILGASSADEQRRFDFFKDIEQKRVALITETGAKIDADRAARMQKELMDAREHAQKLAKIAIDSQQNANVKQREAATNLKKVMEQMSANTDVGIVEGIFGWERGLGNVVPSARDANRKSAAEPLKKRFEELRDAAKQAESAWEADKTNEKLAAFEKAAKDAADAYLNFMRVRFSDRGGVNVGIGGDQNTSPVKQVELLKDSLNQIKEAQDQAKQAQQDQLSVLDSAERLKTQLGGVTAESKKVADEGGKAFETFGQKVLSNEGNVNSVIIALENLRQKVLEVNRTPVTIRVPNSGGGSVDPEYQADGGLLGVNWAPRGTDTIPVMATKGEFMVNAASTRRFLPLLHAINRGTLPRYMAGGGEVTNNTANIRDINISVDGSQGTDFSVRDFGVKLRREMRRGNIIFGRS